MQQSNDQDIYIVRWQYSKVTTNISHSTLQQQSNDQDIYAAYNIVQYAAYSIVQQCNDKISTKYAAISYLQTLPTKQSNYQIIYVVRCLQYCAAK